MEPEQTQGDGSSSVNNNQAPLPENAAQDAPTPPESAPQVTAQQPVLQPDIQAPVTINPTLSQTTDTPVNPGPAVIAPTTQQPSSPQVSQQTEAPAAVPGGVIEPPKSAGTAKRLIIAAITAVVLAVGIGGFVFGYYIPNQPENVWETAMNRTADEMSAFVEKIGDPKIMESLTKNKMTITGAYDGNEIEVDLNVDSKFDKKSTDNTIGLDVKGQQPDQQINLKADFKTQIIDDSLWPNIYFRVSGFSELGISNFLPGINDFEDKWISIEQDFYKEFLRDENGSVADENITQEEIASIASDIASVTNEYLFTADESKAVLKLKEFVGTEESEGIKANRYRTEFQQDKAEDYCKALIDKLFQNKTVRRLDDITDSNQKEKADQEKEDCDFKTDDETSQASAFKDEIDVWIDKKYKLLHKVRIVEDLEAQAKFYQKEKKDCEERSNPYGFNNSDTFCKYYEEQIETGEKYYEFGQIYNGRDEMRLFSVGKSETNREKYEYRADLNVHIKTLIINGRIFVTDKSEDGFGTFHIDINTEPYDGEIDSGKPEDATSIQDVTKYLNQKSEELYSSMWDEGESLGATSDDEGDSGASLFDGFSF